MSFFKIFRNNKINTKTKIPFPIIDIYFFNWNKLIETQIHDHANKGCCLLLLTGELEEKIYDRGIKHINTNRYISPNISYINNEKGFHSVKPLTVSKSLHFYYPKNHITKYYN